MSFGSVTTIGVGGIGCKAWHSGIPGLQANHQVIERTEATHPNKPIMPCVHSGVCTRRDRG